MPYALTSFRVLHFITALFSFLPTDHKHLQQYHFISIANVLMVVAAVTETSTKMSFVSIALAVIFIIRLFNTSTFRAPKLIVKIFGKYTTSTFA